MKIYFAHPQTINYQELYETFKQDSFFNSHELILPHDDKNHQNHTHDFYKTINLMIVEVSKPSTGLGIELGWAFDDNVPIYCFYKNGTTPSDSIRATTNHLSPYQNPSDLCTQIKNIELFQKK